MFFSRFGFGLLCLSVVGVMSRQPWWIRGLCWLYLLLYAVGAVMSVVGGNEEPAILMVPCLFAFLGVFIGHMNEKFRSRE